MTTEDTNAAGDTPAGDSVTPKNSAGNAHIENTPTKTPEEADPDTGDADEVDKWKALARKHEAQAKANAGAAKRLKEIEDADKSESEKLAEALEEAKQDATTTKTELARFRAAIKHGLSEDDLDLLGTGTPEEIEARAERLAARFADGVKADGARPVTSLGKTTDPPVNPDTWLRDLARG